MRPSGGKGRPVPPYMLIQVKMSHRLRVGGVQCNQLAVVHCSREVSFVEHWFLFSFLKIYLGMALI